MEDYSQFQCVDVSNANFRDGACDGNVVGGYCPGAWNVQCCTNPDA
jgi:hypothetical protein